MQKYQVELAGRPLRVTIERDAVARLAASPQPLRVEMELYFSCLIRKRVRFLEMPPEADDVLVPNGISVGFRPVMTLGCGVHEAGGEPPLTDFPVRRAEAFTPHWLHIGLHQGQWQGEFGYDDGAP
ncbi:MAG TPA: hypothetical protein ENJ94_09535 [Gammaproteobacteria bacterium]|nr:hypothetical protein [Gammaproteobacteria bacterium]